MPKKTKRKPTRKQVIAKLDKIFSKYIRLRDSELGWGRCITCNELTQTSKGHCGHFITRGKMNLRWDERNAHLQCCGCNTYRSGEQAKYLIALEGRYGREVVDDLMQCEIG
jgi:hypothetical protein